jgi:hypothetical protein
MTSRLAHDEITLAHGGNTVRLRPSLRAAARLERLHDGFENLFQRVDEFHLGTIRQIITIAATDRQDATAFLYAVASQPLKTIMATTHGPVIELCRALTLASDNSNRSDKTPSKPMPWPEAYRELYRTATGWLHWTPDTAWSATPTEINEAFASHVAMLRAIHGTPEKEAKELDPAQAEGNVTAGLDPEFDREGLRALKAKLT